MNNTRFPHRSPASLARLALVSAGLSLVACSGGLDDARFATGSQSIANSADFKAVYAVSEDDGVVARLDLETQQVFVLELGGEPTRIARNAEHVFVTLRNQRSIAVLKDENGTLSLQTSISVGAEPTGIVLNESGDRLYVAEAMSQNIREIDTESFETLRNWRTANNDPRWLALHPSGDALYVASSLRGELTYIDLREENTVQIVDLIDVQNTNFDSFDAPFEGQGRPPQTVDANKLSRRFTGDPAFTPKGDLLLLPAIFVDNNSPVMEIEPLSDNSPPVETGGYAGNANGTSRFNPSIMIVPVNSEGQVTDREDVEIVGLTAFFAGNSVAAYPTSVSVDPKGEVALATIEGSASIIAIPISDNQPRQTVLDTLLDGPSHETDDFALGAGISSRETFLVQTKAGPRAITFTDDDTGHVFSFLDRSIGEFQQSKLNDQFSGENQEEEDFTFFNIEVGEPANTNNIELRRNTKLFNSRLPSEVEAGRSLFYAATDSRMSTEMAGISCATCHFQGRNDGLTWHFNRSDDLERLNIAARQTPSLAGRVSLTAPLRWDGSRASVADDAMQTSQGLMGGSGLTQDETLRIQAYIDWTRDIDNPNQTADQARLSNGSRLFYSPEIGCGNCHEGARATDNRTHFMPNSGLSLQTRSLVGVFATPPYLHDGSVPTLREVLKNAKQLNMGDTSSLSEQDFEDLLLYVSSL